MERRHDIDWLRVIAIALLIIYHTSIGFQPWGVLIRFIQNGDSLEWVWYPMAMLNMWRIPILFFVSGMGVHFAMQKRTFIELIFERSRRILVPFIFGVLCLVPLHILLWQSYYHQDVSYVLEKGHLWFLWNIFTYVLVLSPLFYGIQKLNGISLPAKLAFTVKHPFIFLLVCLAFIVETLILQPEIYTFYAISWHGYFLGLLSFVFGFVFIALGEIFWKGLASWKWIYLSFATLLFINRIVVYQLEAPDYLMALESVSWIFSMLAIFYQYFKKSSKILSYLSKAAYPIYIIHMLLLYGISYILFPLEISAWIKFGITLILTFVGCLILYEFIIKRSRLLGPLFGLKYRRMAEKNLS